MSVEDTKHFAIAAHIGVNQTYGYNLNYSFHLEWVAKNVEDFYNWKEMGFLGTDALAVAWLHDILDCHNITYQRVLNLTSYEVAEAVLLLKENKGRNRREKHSDHYFEEIASNDLATFVKLCDILANATYCVYTVNKGMLKAYKEDFLLLLSFRDDWAAYNTILDRLDFVLNTDLKNFNHILDESTISFIETLADKYRVA